MILRQRAKIFLNGALIIITYLYIYISHFADWPHFAPLRIPLSIRLKLIHPVLRGTGTMNARPNTFLPECSLLSQSKAVQICQFSVSVRTLCPYSQ